MVDTLTRIKNLGKSVGSGLTKALSTRSKEELLAQSSEKGGKKSTKVGTEVDRIEFKKLEKLYYMEPLVFSGVSFYVSQVTGPEFEVKDMGSPKATKITIDFLDKIDIDSKISKIMQDLCLYGNAFVELVRNSRGEIADIEPVDPKKMEFIEDRNGNVLTDEFGEPIGYIEKVNKQGDASIEDVIEEKGLDPNEIRYRHKRGIVFSSDEIAHFKLNSLSDTMMGVGIVEPVYDTAVLKLKAEESLGNALNKVGFPKYVAKLGKEDIHEPTQDEIKTFDEDVLANLEDADSLTMPYFYDIETLGPQGLERLQGYLEYYEEQIVTGLGVPHSILTKGDRIGTGVVDIGVDRIEKKIQIYQKKLASMLRNLILAPLVEEQELNVDKTPKIEFRTTSPSALTQKADRLAELADAGIITPDEVLEKRIRSLEDLPQKGESDRTKRILEEDSNDD